MKSAPLILATVLLAGTAAAEDIASPSQPVITPTARVFAQYSLKTVEGESPENAFELTRIYLGAKARITPKLEATVLLDGNRYGEYEVTTTTYTTDDDGHIIGESSETVVYDGGNDRLNVFVKNAFLQVNDVLPGVAFQAGMMGTPWYSLEEGLWGHRYVAKTYADQWSLLSTADLGLGIIGKHGGGLLQYHLVAVNGTGFRKPEGDTSKLLQGRVTLTPLVSNESLKGLQLTAFGAVEPSSTAPSKVFGGLLSFQHRYLTVAGGYLAKATSAETKGGPFAWLVVHPSTKAHVFARFDLYDSDKEGVDPQRLLLAGFSYDFLKHVSVAADLSFPDFGGTNTVVAAVHSVFQF